MKNDFEGTIYYSGYLIEKALGISEHSITDRNVSGRYITIDYIDEVMINNRAVDDYDTVEMQHVLSVDFGEPEITLSIPKLDMNVPVPTAVLDVFNQLTGNTPTF